MATERRYSLKTSIALTVAAVSAAGALYFSRIEPWSECVSRAIELKEFGQIIGPREDFRLPSDHEERMDKVRKAKEMTAQGNPPPYVTNRCGPRPQ